MRLLILGYSSIAERRVIPAAAKLSKISAISIASMSRPEPQSGWSKKDQFFTDYEHALRDSDCDVVYLSLPNALHEKWIFAALASGKHVLVDKPATLTLESSARAVGEARRRGLLLAEATVFSYHSHFHALFNFLAETDPLTHVAARFIIPPLPLKNFRNHIPLGGGCLLDMGSYAARLINLFGGGKPTNVSGIRGGTHPDTSVDMGFSVQAKLANGAHFSGQFSFEGEYQNRLTVVSRSGCVEIDRVFSPPADYRMVWSQRKSNIESAVSFDPVDTFENFLIVATEAIATNTLDNFYDDLLADAKVKADIGDALHSSI